jgi:hypothetical protein
MVDGLVSAAFAGEGACLRLVGDPGIGKTRLLQESAARARLLGCHAPTVRSSQAETHLRSPRSTSCCSRCSAGVNGLSPARRAALGRAFGLQDGPAPDRFFVGLGVLR